MRQRPFHRQWQVKVDPTERKGFKLIHLTLLYCTSVHVDMLMVCSDYLTNRRKLNLNYGDLQSERVPSKSFLLPVDLCSEIKHTLHSMTM